MEGKRLANLTKAVKHRHVSQLHNDKVLSGENVRTNGENAQEPLEDEVNRILLDSEQPLVASNSEVVHDPYYASASTEEQIRPLTPDEHEASEKPELFKEGQCQQERPEKSAGASVQDPAHYDGINTNLEDHPYEDLHPIASSHEKLSPKQQPQSKELREQQAPELNEEDSLDSDLDDDEDVANCLLSQSEVDLRARNWTDEEHESVVPLNVRSLARFTGVREIDARDLFEELRDAEPEPERKPEPTSTHSTISFQDDCITSGAVGSPFPTAADIKINTEKTAEVNDSIKEEDALNGSVIVSKDLGREQAATLDVTSFGRLQSLVASTMYAADAGKHRIEACHADNEYSDPDSDAGVAISANDYNLKTKESETASTSSGSSESPKGSFPANEVSSAALGDGIPPSWSSKSNHEKHRKPSLTIVRPTSGETHTASNCSLRVRSHPRTLRLSIHSCKSAIRYAIAFGVSLSSHSPIGRQESCQR